MEIKDFKQDEWNGLTTKNIGVELSDDDIRKMGKNFFPMFNWDGPLMEVPKIEYCKCCGQVIHR